MVTLYVMPPPLLGTAGGFQFDERLQLPVPPFHVATTCPYVRML